MENSGATAVASSVPSGMRGGCLCGAVRYRVTGPATMPSACHCHMCRRFHGALGTFIGAKRDAFELLGAEHILWFSSSTEAERGSCAICGSKLFWRQIDGAAMDATTGSLDQLTGLDLRAHIWVDHRGDYEEIADEIPKFAASSIGADGEPAPTIELRPVSSPMLEQDRRSGSCLCTAIRFEIEGAMPDVVVCHCAQCRHWHGDAAAYSAVERSMLTIQDDRPLQWYQASPQLRRGFCRQCGSCLFSQVLQDGQLAAQISISVGALDAPTGLRTARHLFIGDQVLGHRLGEVALSATGAWSPGQAAF